MIKSPITGNDSRFVKKIETEYIVKLYQDRHAIDVSRYFYDLEYVDIRICEDTGYQFFHPFNITGDAHFYDELYSKDASEDWAYKDVRWEFRWALDQLSARAGKVLDIGCGSGAFLQLVSQRASQLTGLETNPSGAAEAEKAGLHVYRETIEDHARHFVGFYDVITAFQVLEHIWNVAAFMDAATTALAPKGLLVIAVPNNASFVGMQEDLPLNLPPHHVGLWRPESLACLASAFSLRLVALEREPLQQDNLGWYQAWMERRYLPQSRLARIAYYRLGVRNGVTRYLADNCHTIDGHSVVAIFCRS